MGRWVQGWFAPRSLAAALVLLAVLARAATPPGWMPNPQAASAGPVLVICTAQGERLASPQPGGQDHPHRQGHEVCAFAGVHAAPPDPAQTLPEPAGRLRLAATGPAGVAPVRAASRHRDQAQRAPPTFV